ncbi:dihydroorotase [Salibacter halophilus]|uniref:Dihydroorotase n=2 Tax=Salibacter halophilus TaxID=1803916 RepID=A0A6N6M4D8_9FLAO|nr:dihydroorotase [Salibacter halophilus]
MVMRTLIKNATIINEDKQFVGDVLIEDEFIIEVGEALDKPADKTIDASGKILIPGMIDDQVHFREPGLTHKAEIKTESRAAVAGGITSYMEMPNTIPQATTIDLLEDKYKRANEVSLANYSFYMGTTNKNLDELLKIDQKKICGVKIFMGSSTGDMVVDDEKALEKTFEEVKTLIATHCENDPMIGENAKKYRAKYGENVPIECHPDIRSREACYKSSSYAKSLADKYGTRLHILHISSKEELDLFRNDIPMKEKHVTSEACIHHMWFSREDYKEKGTHIKWNPAVKEREDAEAILQAVNDDRIDVIATDHAPHTLEEKDNTYFKAPSGGPLVQHALPALFEFWKQGKLTLEKIVRKTSHNVADMFSIEKRGYIKPGYYADLVLIDPEKPLTVSKDNLLYKCGWSPFEGTTFQCSIDKTFVNGYLAWDNGHIHDQQLGKRLTFDR